MKICICYIGLQRTISKTYLNLEENIIDNKNEFIRIYVTWKNENIDSFLSLFPNTIVHRVDEVTIEDEDFKKWKLGLQMHISWRRTYDPEYALFRYYQQIYLWKKAAMFINSIKDSFDLMLRLRTDITISGKLINNYYENIKENSIYFPTEPRQSILGNGTGCPDHLFMGKASIIIKALSIIDYLYKYKIDYIEYGKQWFTEPTKEENIIQPESSLYQFLIGENINIEFMDNKIDIIR